MDVFDLAAKLTLDSTEYDKGLTQAESDANSFGSKAGKALGKLGKIGIGAIAGATTATVAFGKQSVETGMQFDSAMSQVAATMGKSMSEIETDVGSVETSFGHFQGNLREFAQFMGANTAFSASQAADALNYMALAGYNTQQSMEMLPNVLSLAAAGSMDLATASDMITDAQTALGLSFADTNVMVDQMAKAASTTNTSVSQLGEAILTIGGTAQFMAGGTEELNAVLGVLADNGIKGSEAGTHLRNMLLKLSDPTDAGANAMEDLGLKVYDAEGKMRSMEAIFTDLNTAMADFTEEQKVQTFSALFNTRDVASATALLNTTTERWSEVKGAIDDASGSAAQMAATQLDNLNGDITIFKSALEGAQIVLSDQLTPTLRDFVQFGTSGIQQITQGFQEGGLAGAMEALGNIISEGLAKAIDNSQVVINAALSLLESIGKALRDNAPALISAAADVLNMVLEKLPGLVDIAGDILLSVIEGLTDALPKILPNLLNAILSITQKVVDLLPTILTSLISLVETIANFILNDGLPIILNILPDLISSIVDFILSASTQITDLVVEIGMMLVNAIPELYAIFASVLPDLITKLFKAIVSNAPALGEAIMQLVVQSLVILPQIFIEVRKHVPELFETIVKGMVENWPTLKQAAIDAFKQFSEGTTSGEVISHLSENVAKFILKGIEKIKSFVSDFKDVGKFIMDGLIEGIQGKIGEITNVISGVASTVSTSFKKVLGIASPSKLFESYGNFIDIGLAQGIDKGIGTVDNAMDSLYDSVLSLPKINGNANIGLYGDSESGYNGIVEAFISALQQIGPMAIVRVDGNRDKIVDITVQANRDYQRMTGASLYGV